MCWKTFSQEQAKAAPSVMPENSKTFNVDNVRVVKIMGGGLASCRVWYLARNLKVHDTSASHRISRQGRWTFGRRRKLEDSTKRKSGCLHKPIDIVHTETKGTFLIKNADDMLNFTGGEKHMEKVHI